MNILPLLGFLTSVTGVLLYPVWSRVQPGVGFYPYLWGLGLVPAGIIMMMIGLAWRLRRGRKASWASGLTLMAITLFGFYWVLEFGALIYMKKSGKGAALQEFRNVQLQEMPAKFVNHPFLIYTKNPKLPGVNSLGFNGPEWAREKKPGTFRVACLGGSTTEDGYPEHLERMLRARYPERAVEVLNFGVSGWTTANSMINYGLNVRHYRPDLVVLHEGANEFKMTWYGTPRSDYSHAYQVLTPPALPLDAWLIRNLNGYALIKWKVMALRKTPAGAVLEDAVMKPAPILGGIPQQIEPVRAICRSNVETMARMIRADGTRLLIMTQPYSRTNLGWSENFVKFMERINDGIREAAAGEGTGLIDLDQQFKGKETWHIDPLHLNAEGVEAKAGVVAGAIEKIW